MRNQLSSFDKFVIALGVTDLAGFVLYLAFSIFLNLHSVDFVWILPGLVAIMFPIAAILGLWRAEKWSLWPISIILLFGIVHLSDLHPLPILLAGADALGIVVFLYLLIIRKRLN